MKQRLYLHAGLHKTGTSSIQVELTRARHLLAERGFLYPFAGVPDWAPFGHHLLPWTVVRDDALIPTVRGRHPGNLQHERDDIWDELHREIEASQLPNVILSSEEFDILDRSALDELAHQLARYEVVPILYLRNIGDLVESGYRTAVLISGFEQDITHYASHQRTRSDFFQLLKDWEAISTTRSLFVVSYDDEHLRQDSVLTFLRLMGLTADAIEPERLPKQNESAPAFVVEMIRHLRSLGAQEADIATWTKTLSALPYRPGANERYELLGPDLRAELDGRYIRELEAISSDSALASQVLGKLMIPAVPEREHVEGIDQALSAFGRELGHSFVSISI